MPACNVDYYVTKLSPSYGSSVTLNVYWPQDSHIVIRHVPIYDLIDYLLYICSSFGIWVRNLHLLHRDDSKARVRVRSDAVSYWETDKIQNLFRNAMNNLLISHNKLCRQFHLHESLPQTIEVLIKIN